MYRHKLVSLLGMLILLLTVLPVAAAQPPAADKIEPRLLDRFTAEGTSDFTVHFVEQADLSAAYAMDWDARGWYVYNTLTATAARAQARAQGYLDQQGLPYTSFFSGNELYVRGGTLPVATALAALPEVAALTAPRTYYVDPILATAPVAAPEALAWGIIDVNADDFWSAFGVQGDSIVVANVDTGVQWNHPALDQAFKCGGNPSDPACWADPSNICGGSACDNNGHGSHTMGTMVGDDDPSLTWQAGMAPNATWIACKGCETNSCSEFALNSCADWIVAPNGNPANRPNVVNNSWGGGGCSNWYLAKVQAWRAAGTFPAFSAGNNGSSCTSMGSPGDYQESFASAAHDSSRNVASFSSRGPSCYGHDPYTKPNISAPGVSVCSTIPTNSWSCGYSGTSMASPHSAGAVALLWSCNPSLVGQIDQTMEILQDNADAAPAGNCGAPPDGEGNYTYGYGYLNVYAAGLLWCGDVGYLDGHVYDVVTGDPIEGAVVDAGGPTATTDAAGYYNMTLIVGTYDVTASHPQYEPYTETGVAITVGATTTVDFDLAPRGWLYGYVTDYDNGFPLEGAVVTAEDGTWAATDAAGYYEMYLDEGTIVVTATMADYAPESATVTIVSGAGTQQDFALQAAVVFIPAPLHVYVPWDSTYSEAATLTNRLPTAYDFVFGEEAGGFVPGLESYVQVTIPAGPRTLDPATAAGQAPEYTPRPAATYNLPQYPKPEAAPSVMLVCSDYQPLCEPIRAQLQAFGDLAVVDAFDAQAGTPTLAQLLPYDVVLTWSNYQYADPTGIGNVLADYVDAGGRVINLMFAMGTHGWQMGGRFMTENYTAMNGTSLSFQTLSLGTYDPNHPIMSKPDVITNITDYYHMDGSYLTPNAYAVAQWSNGWLFIAAKDDRSVVSINGYVGGSTQWTGQMDQMIHNAILWMVVSPNVPWFGQDPVSGTVAAGSSINPTMLFTATADVGVTQPGDYWCTLNVDGEPDLAVHVTMTVLPADDMGQVYGYVLDNCTGAPVTATIDITVGDPITQTMSGPTGYYSAWLYSGTYTLDFSAPDYLPVTEAVSIVAGETVELNVDLIPDRGCIAADPLFFEVWVITGTQVVEAQTIWNEGGADLNYEYQEKDGGYIPPLGRTELPLNPAVVPDIPLTTGLAPAGYVPQAGLAGGMPEGPWQSRATAPFVSMDNVYLDYDGMGYLLSGYGANGQVGIYNPNTDSWTAGATEPAPQIQYPVDGCLGLNAGGEPVGILFNDSTSGATTLHRYNMATNAWDTPPVPAGFPANGLWAHDVVSMLRYSGQNVCYISGGATTPGGGNTSALYAYYPDTNTAVNLGNFNYLAGGFAFHASWYAPWVGSDGAICVAGGVNASSVVSGDTQCYDIGAAAFNATNADLGAMPAGVWGMADDVLYEGGDYQLWLANGADTAFALWPNSAYYSSNDSAWHTGPTPPTTVYRVEGVNISAADGCSFYVVGGSTGGFTPSNGHNRNYSSDCPPVGAPPDVPWVWEYPISGTVPAQSSAVLDIGFTSYYTDVPTGTLIHLPLGTYTATLKLKSNDSVAGTQDVPVIMHIIDQVVTPTADFTATTPVCAGEEMWFYFTGDVGLPPADQYTWWFGDGISLTVGTPDPVMHTYDGSGTYTVTLIVCNMGGCTGAWHLVDVLALPEAGFSYAANGLEVTFTDESQYATSWWWDMGDGVGTSTETNPVYTYLAEGTYTVTQYVYNDCGEAMAQQVLTVVACEPAEIVTVTEEISGCVVTFVPELAGTAPLTWLWDFGAFGTSTETSPVVDFGTSGTYPYTLTAENACGADEWVDAVTVECVPPCQDVAIVTYTYEIAGCVVDFGLELTGDEPFTYLWAFGDGMTSTLAAPTYTYLASGTYNVMVDVYNCAAGHDMASFDVTVDCGLTTYYLYLPLIVKLSAP